MKCFLILLFLFTIPQLSAQVYIRDSSRVVKQGSRLTALTGSLNFLAIGDWGRNGADHQRQVADQLGKTAAETGAQFIISTGDNFYPSGVISEHDPLFKYSYEDIYTAFSLQWDWYVILGNHDYKSNPDAQVAYSKISRRWKMPARYYAKKFAINGDTTKQVLIAFIDTNPLIPQFYANPEYGPNVRTQDTAAQKLWLEKTLSDPSPNIAWKIVVGHHPMYTGGSRTNGYDTRATYASLDALLTRHKVDIYLSGHEHSLQHLTPTNKAEHFISGAGSEKTPAILVNDSRMAASQYGFMVFSATAKEMMVQVVDHTGRVFYRTSIKK
ncbi:acid phosphatase [Segetibacter sp. 3557_3]|uniref:purple acid phosphatase family protein n=1 Tax=Segetibacter sp. 3557_3 TaxID=2547429 RepID=UPI0010586972|nr:tartrate-resistant acid phosphatase type 5 family protein [Segetibacter sp. 3557_3]TDH21583.1 acid phosphatase [Segetibacter sp. 3557_3]